MTIARTFDLKSAERGHTPLLIGLVSPSGAGKTYSALRLATGIQRVCGGSIAVVDSEARRALHYAPLPGQPIGPGQFKFDHLPFGAPFSPLDYLAAIEHCVKSGAKTVIVDSTSHEHDGSGGVLEMHEAELDRRAGNDYGKREALNMLAWQKPKNQRRKLINALLQMDCNFILCFRAKEKLQMVKGKSPIELGYCPIASKEFIYEMTVKFLFLPGANGVPVLSSEYPAEREMIKIPGQFRHMFDPANPQQLTEATGEALARWAMGGADQKLPSVPELLASYASCAEPATFRALESQRQALWRQASTEQKQSLKDASDKAQKRSSEPMDPCHPEPGSNDTP